MKLYLAATCLSLLIMTVPARADNISDAVKYTRDKLVQKFGTDKKTFSKLDDRLQSLEGLLRAKNAAAATKYSKEIQYQSCKAASAPTEMELDNISHVDKILFKEAPPLRKLYNEQIKRGGSFIVEFGTCKID